MDILTFFSGHADLAASASDLRVAATHVASLMPLMPAIVLTLIAVSVGVRRRPARSRS